MVFEYFLNCCLVLLLYFMRKLICFCSLKTFLFSLFIVILFSFWIMLYLILLFAFDPRFEVYGQNAFSCMKWDFLFYLFCIFFFIDHTLFAVWFVQVVCLSIRFFCICLAVRVSWWSVDSYFHWNRYFFCLNCLFYIMIIFYPVIFRSMHF